MSQQITMTTECGSRTYTGDTAEDIRLQASSDLSVDGPRTIHLAEEWSKCWMEPKTHKREVCVSLHGEWNFNVDANGRTTF